MHISDTQIHYSTRFFHLQNTGLQKATQSLPVTLTRHAPPQTQLEEQFSHVSEYKRGLKCRRGRLAGSGGHRGRGGRGRLSHANISSEMCAAAQWDILYYSNQ